MNRGRVSHPTAENSRVVVEVSDTTYEHDRKKIALFVRANVPAFIVNLQAKRVERYGSQAELEEPHGTIFTRGQSLEFFGVAVTVADLFENV